MNRPGKAAPDWKRQLLRGELPAEEDLRSMDLSGEGGLTALPKGLRGFSLNLSNTGIAELPAELRIEFKLNLTDCAALTSLPRGLKTGSLVLRGCHALRTLPEDLEVSFLTLDGCANLEGWPESARVSVGSVSARDCVNLAALPATLQSLTNLDLRGCRRITNLPPGLRLSGWLDLAGTGIQSLPESLRGVRLRWRGVEINAQIAFFPETLTVAQILAEPNAEVRRVMLERHGVDNFMREADAHVLDEDTDPGGPRRLLRVPMPGDEDLVCVSLHCPSTARQYLIRVPPDIRTCHAAVAWTAGYDDPDDYHPLVDSCAGIFVFPGWGAACRVSRRGLSFARRPSLHRFPGHASTRGRRCARPTTTARTLPCTCRAPRAGGWAAGRRRR